MKKRFWILGLVLVLLIAVSAGCGMGGQEATLESGTTSGEPPRITTSAIFTQPMPTVTASPSKGGDGYYYDESQGAYAPVVERMIIRSGNMALVVENVKLSLDQIAAMAETYQGWVVTSNTWQDNQRVFGNISIRVAAEHFDTVRTALRGLAVEVRSENTSGQDVTDEYVDLQAQLVTLEASEAQLLELMKQAGTVEEILEVQRELTNTRTKIEQISGRMQYLEQSTATSLLSITLEQSQLTVEFTANQRNIKTGEEIQFNPQVSGGFAPYTYEWDFGDGETSTSDWSAHKYSKEGTYTVSLKITDDKGNIADYTRENYITVQPGWSAGSVAGNAAHGLATFGRGLLNVIIYLGIFSPVWIVIGVVVFLIVRKKRSKK